jgi:L-lactate dehydrogenase complex protein LldG
MSSRNAILTALRQSGAPVVPLPEPPVAVTYDDPGKQFADALAATGGTAVFVGSRAECDAELRKLDHYVQARKIASLVPGVGTSNVDLEAMRTPQELEGLDLAILSGDFAVAENAAVWVPGTALGPHRAIFVITQHLVLVVPADQVLSTMQQAYERLRFDGPGYGVFLSGPSKTADIEQALVIGAQGARSCTVFLVQP